MPPLPPPSASAVLRHPVRVYYDDTDAAGVVYYANYLRFCERARTEWLRAAGFEQRQLRAEHGLVFMVRSATADFLSPGLLDDALEVETRVETLARASLVFAQTVLRDDERLFDAKFLIACVDLNKRRPVAFPAAVRTQLERLLSA